jgi:hypothetical protein
VGSDSMHGVPKELPVMTYPLLILSANTAIYY